MPEKIDLGAMAQAAHRKQVEARKDGGPGSGPKPGGGSGARKEEFSFIRSLIGKAEPAKQKEEEASKNVQTEAEAREFFRKSGPIKTLSQKQHEETKKLPSFKVKGIRGPF